MSLPRSESTALVEPVGDLVALAQAHALDATVFPFGSLPMVFGPNLPPTVWVARAHPGGPVIGFVATSAKGGALEIRGLAIEEEHRRTGLGRALVRVALRSARSRGLALVSLHVSVGNRGALALYLAEGFRIERRLSHYYLPQWFPNNGDAFLMLRDLDD